MGIVIVSIITISFMALTREDRVTTESYGQTIRLGITLDAASQLILSEIKQEIRQGSTVAAPLNSAGIPNQEIFLPKNEYFSQPAAINTPTEKADLPNLIRRSARESFRIANAPTSANYPFTANPFTLTASDSATTDVSANGRSMTLERWNKPKLMDPTKIAPFQAPDWILLTRDGPLIFTNPSMAKKLDGSNVATPKPADMSLTNINRVVGRFAYTLYRIDNGLDLTAAGGPATGLPSSHTSRQRIAPFADLTQLPDFTASLQQEILKFRNSLTSTNLYNITNPKDPGTFFGWATDSRHGFLSPASGDQKMLTRQELLKFLDSHGIDLSISTLPQHLTVFSREKNTPSFAPVPARAKIHNGFPYFGQDDEMNPPFPQMVFPSDVTIPLDETMSVPLEIKAGDPLVARRFALSRLAWLGRSGPSALNGGNPAGTPANIRRYFGLTWDAANKRWVYNHGNPNKIYTLQELQANMSTEMREPDFFELLKATIAAGSLAMEANTSTTQPSVKAESENLDLHILKIAANMIDQADADGYPTVLTYSNGGGFPEAYGIEDLPYLHKIYPIFLRTSTSSNEVNGYALPELFRPHYTASAAPPADTPTDFRVVVREFSVVKVRTSWTDDPLISYNAYPSIGATAPTSPATLNPAGGWKVANGVARNFSSADENSSAVEFSVTSTHLFDSPSILTDTNSGTSNPANQVSNTIYSNLYGSGDWTAPNGTGDKVFNVGAPKNGWNLIRLASVITGNNLTAIIAPIFDVSLISFGLQYRDGNTWRTYSEWKNITNAQAINFFGRIGGMSPDVHYFIRHFHLMKLDPRTERLSADMLSNDISWSNDEKSVENKTLGHPSYQARGYWAARYSAWSGANYSGSQRFQWDTNNGTPAGDASKFREWTQLQRNKQGGANSSFYFDPDGVVRGADGYYASNFAGPEANKIGVPMADTPNFISRPVILNRPFRSVAEVGYVYRDLPWRSLDFFTSKSADATLLDVFSVDEAPQMRAGVINLNTPFPVVLQTLLSAGTAKVPLQEVNLTSPASTATTLEPADITNLAAAVVAKTKIKPLQNKAELVTTLAEDATISASYADADSPKIKARRETFVRALGEATATRTWNLMIDLVVQVGRYPSNRTVADLGSSFIVEGERRIWWHLAIDRYTGEIVDQQIEPVYE